MSSKYLDKVAKLLAQAENAGTPEEAATFMAKVQELATANDIDLAVARAHQASKERTVPEERRIQVNPYSRRNNRKHFLELAMEIARVNDVAFLIGGKEHVLHAVGFSQDLDLLETLYTHLSIQMVTECNAALKRGEHKEERYERKQIRHEIPEDAREWGGWDETRDRPYASDESQVGDYHYGLKLYPPPKYRLEDVLDDDGRFIVELKTVSAVNGQVFRYEFYGAFIRRMGARLRDAKKQAMKDAGADVETSGSALAIRDKKEDVQKASEEQRAKVHHLGVYNGTDSDARSNWDHTGRAEASGRRSAESVPIGEGREIG